MAVKGFPHGGIRDGVYQYRRRVPQKVIELPDKYEELFGSRPFVRESLGTKNYSDALKAAALLEKDFDARVEKALGRQPLPETAVRHVQVTLAALGRVSSDICTKAVLAWRRDIQRANVDVDARDYLEHRLDQFIDERDGSDVNTAVLWGRSPLDYAREVNVKMGFSVSEKSAEFEELVAAVIDGCQQARRSINDLFDGHSVPVAPTSTLIQNFAKATSGAPSSKTFSDVSALHFSTKKLAAKTRAKMKRSQDLFIQLIGDKNINDYTKADVRLFLDHLAERQVGTASNRARPISQGTLQSYVSGISSPFNFAVGRGWVTDGNPALGMRIEDWRDAPSAREVPKRRRFSVDELNAIFQHPWFSGCHSKSKSYRPGDVLLNDMRYWAPVVAIYTGARAAELGGLMLEEIHLKDDAPHILFRCNKYRNTKFELERHVPILDALLRLGFADYVERIRETGADRLFPDWKLPIKDAIDDTFYNWANAKWIRAFNRTVIPAVLPEIAASETRSPVVFHSFRGAFKFMLLGHGNPHLANAVIGHSQDDLDKAYIGNVAPKETYGAFRYADFIDVKIPTRKPS